MNTQASPGVLGTKIPSTVVFAVGVLLFFMPFAELQCKQKTQETMGGFDFNLGGQTTISNTGFGLAIGKEWKMQMNGLGGLFSGNNDKLNKDQPKQDPNSYAIAAFVLGILGLAFCIIKIKGGTWIAMIAGILSAVALIGLRFDLDKKVKNPSEIIQKNENSSDWVTGLDTMRFELEYTPWFYITIIAMIVAAILCYIRLKNTGNVTPVAQPSTANEGIDITV
jgi:hypothetical protein